MKKMAEHDYDDSEEENSQFAELSETGDKRKRNDSEDDVGHMKQRVGGTWDMDAEQSSIYQNSQLPSYAQPGTSADADLFWNNWDQGFQENVLNNSYLSTSPSNALGSANFGVTSDVQVGSTPFDQSGQASSYPLSSSYSLHPFYNDEIPIANQAPSVQHGQPTLYASKYPYHGTLFGTQNSQATYSAITFPPNYDPTPVNSSGIDRSDCLDNSNAYFEEPKNDLEDSQLLGCEMPSRPDQECDDDLDIVLKMGKYRT